jgi:hypothetical protein
MVDLALLQSVSYMAGALGVCVAAIYYVMNLRISQKNQELTLKALEQSAKAQELALKAQQQNLETRQAQLLMQIWDKVNNKDFLEDWVETLWDWKFDTYEEYVNKYGSKPEEVSKLTHVCDTLSGIGVLLGNRLVGPKMLYRLLLQGWAPIMYWEKYGPSLKEFGRRTGEPKMYAGLEFLSSEFSRLYEEEHGYRYGHKLRSMDDALASVADDNKTKPP